MLELSNEITRGLGQINDLAAASMDGLYTAIAIETIIAAIWISITIWTLKTVFTMADRLIKIKERQPAQTRPAEDHDKKYMPKS